MIQIFNVSFVSYYFCQQLYNCCCYTLSHYDYSLHLYFLGCLSCPVTPSTLINIDLHPYTRPCDHGEVYFSKILKHQFLLMLRLQKVNEETVLKRFASKVEKCQPSERPFTIKIWPVLGSGPPSISIIKSTSKFVVLIQQFFFYSFKLVI